MKVVIEPVGDGNHDGNRGELWRTLANVGGRAGQDSYTGRTLANCGERRRTEKLKTARVQALVGSNPTPSVFEFHPLAGVAPVS
jgi:hypothetical protein